MKYYIYYAKFSKNKSRPHIGMTKNPNQRNNHHKTEMIILEEIPQNNLTEKEHKLLALDREEYWQKEYGFETDREKWKAGLQKAGKNENSWNWKKQWEFNREQMLIHVSNAGKAGKGVKHKVTNKTMRAVKIAAEVAHRKVKCPYCDAIGGHAIMQRWHYEKCKYKI